MTMRLHGIFASYLLLSHSAAVSYHWTVADVGQEEDIGLWARA